MVSLTANMFSVLDNTIFTISAETHPSRGVPAQQGWHGPVWDPLPTPKPGCDLKLRGQVTEGQSPSPLLPTSPATVSEPRPCLEPWGQVVCLDSGPQGTHQTVWLGWCLPPNPPKFEERRHQAPSIARLIPTHGISLEAISKKGISDQSV